VVAGCVYVQQAEKCPPSPRLRQGDYAPASASDSVPSSLDFAPRFIRSFGGKGIRTPDFQLAKLALYQLSYAPAFRIAECRLAIADFNPEKLSGLGSCFPGRFSKQISAAWREMLV